VRDVLSVRKLEKVSGTYINNFLKEEVDGLIHPSYGLIIPRSYRSQSNDPNFQNNPIRDDMMSKIIRRGVIVREPNRQIGELDYGQQEVRVAGCLTGDPNLIEYVTSPNKDMHTDMAMRVFILTERQVTKKIRYCAKNRFVFPEFYGSWWKEVAINLWKSIGEFDLETADGIPLKEHLADYGITELGKVIKTKNGLKPEKGTFMEHIAQVEDWYWNELYHEYTKWKERHWKRYLRKGYFDTLTGFRVSGPMSKNQTINIPVQGPAFHCLLWSFIELTDYLEKQKMESLLIGQIHDSALGDFVSDELPDFLTTAKRIMTEDIRKAWEWLIVPLVIEAEISPPGGSWYDKQEEPI
jgi:DNA polymerase-1